MIIIPYVSQQLQSYFFNKIQPNVRLTFKIRYEYLICRYEVNGCLET
jgi:hypothetical protein